MSKRTCVYCSKEFDDNILSREVHYRLHCTGYAKEQEAKLRELTQVLKKEPFKFTNTSVEDAPHKNRFWDFMEFFK